MRLNFLKLFDSKIVFKAISGIARYSSNTIYAPATPRGKSALAIIRISGPNSKNVYMQMTREKAIPKPRVATQIKLFEPSSSTVLDHAITLWFPSPRSATGEDVCELHVHGGPAVISATLASLARLPDFALAEPGEFTRRAFLNGKLDLTEAEGLGDLIHADTEAQRQRALQLLGGKLSSVYQRWTDQLKLNVAKVEAYIDFAEDSNIEDNVLEDVKVSLHDLCGEVQEHLSGSCKGERLRNGLKIAIVGEPNVGKSTLLNTLIQRDAAIVSPIAGTTRDIIESAYELAGYPVVFCDTAGLHTHTQDPVEKEGMRRARHSVEEADLVVVMAAASQLRDNVQQEQLLSRLELELSPRQQVLVVANKWDLCPQLRPDSCPAHLCLLSCQTGQGLSHLVARLSALVAAMCGDPLRDSASLCQERHRLHLASGLRELEQGLAGLDQDVVLAAEHLRQGLICLGRVTGHVSTEDILDLVFSSFCIGK